MTYFQGALRAQDIDLHLLGERDDTSCVNNKFLPTFM